MRAMQAMSKRVRLVAVSSVLLTTVVSSSPIAAMVASPSTAVSSGSVDGLRATRVDGITAVINWQMTPGAARYRILVDGQDRGVDDDGWFTLRFLRPLTTHSITVVPVFADGDGTPSAPIEVTTSDISLRDPRLHVDTGTYRLTSSLVPFSWDIVPFTSIELWRDGVQLDPSEVGRVNQRLLDGDVVSGETYSYRARLVSSASGAVGEFGPEIVVTVPGRAPAVGEQAPTLSVPFADRQVAVLRLDDLPSGATSYEIERDGQVIISIEPGHHSVRWFADRTVEPDGSHDYRVRATVDGVPGRWSSVAVAETVRQGAASTAG